MRKVRIRSNVLGVISTSAAPFPALFGRFPESSTLQNEELRKSHSWAEQKPLRTVEPTGRRGLANYKKMDDSSQYSDIFGNNEIVSRRSSTFEDVQQALSLLKEIIEYRDQYVSSWIIEGKVKNLCSLYKCLLKDHKSQFIEELAQDYGVKHAQIFQSAKSLAKHSQLSEDEASADAKIIKNEEQLRNQLTPQYSWLFLHIGKQEKGVKFLVDFRTDILDLIAEKNAGGQNTLEIQQLNLTLRELLSLWFSIGFLHLERVTWNSSCDMLQKISEYEAVHPIKNWTDLKRRVGPYRRCFVFLHASMPGEPIVVLHTALCDVIASSLKGIVSARSRMSIDQTAIGKETFDYSQEEDPDCVKAAVFYSITSTQKGLQGIELGNYLIKSVVRELQIEFPQMTQFSSLSPIPKFKNWLMEKIKASEKGPNETLLQEEVTIMKTYFGTDFWKELRRVIFLNSWVEDERLVNLLEQPLMRLCARYLYVEKRRGYALDSVANFHLRNGAVLWRLNWLADVSPRGLGNSCSIMVNYRYFLDDTRANSQKYLETQSISASEHIVQMAEEARRLLTVSKM